MCHWLPRSLGPPASPQPPCSNCGDDVSGFCGHHYFLSPSICCFSPAIPNRTTLAWVRCEVSWWGSIAYGLRYTFHHTLLIMRSLWGKRTLSSSPLTLVRFSLSLSLSEATSSIEFEWRFNLNWSVLPELKNAWVGPWVKSKIRDWELSEWASHSVHCKGIGFLGWFDDGFVCASGEASLWVSP